jgi:hypothetical protein
MKTLLPIAALLAVPMVATATETEHNTIPIFPAPGPVTIDGGFSDWNLAGSVLICSDVENYRDQFSSWQSAMYDADNLYFLSRWNDTTPLNNPGLCGADAGFAGDCLQLRIVTNTSGDADKGGGVERTVHLDGWRGRDGRDVVSAQYGKQFDQEKHDDLKELGARQAFRVDDDGKGYVQEIAIPWKLLCAEGYTPKAGDSILLTYEPNFGTESKLRITTKDVFRKGVVPDRVFMFMASQHWAPVKLLAEAPSAPPPVRLSDGRTFPVALGEGGTMDVDWTGLVKSDKPEGFLPIAFDMPEDGYVSMILRDADGYVVRNLLNGTFFVKGRQEVLWDGLTTPSDRRPGDPVPAGEYTWEAICHKGANLTLVGWAHNAGVAPYDCPGGNWGGDHGCPSAVECAEDSVYLGWTAAEAGQGIVCADLTGKVKWRHKRGGFGGAHRIAAEGGFVYVYDLSHDNAIYRLSAANGEYASFEGTTATDFSVAEILAPFAPPDFEAFAFHANGLAALDGRLYLSWDPAAEHKDGKGGVIAVLDAATRRCIGSIRLDAPRGVKTGADGRLYAIDGETIVRIDPVRLDATPIARQPGAVAVAADAEGNLYVALDDARGNTVQVFSADGGLRRSIGDAGGRPLQGPWVATGLRFMKDLDVGADGMLWISEEDDRPKRFSQWTAATGELVKEFFGPSAYGALGGAICPTDPLTMVGQGCEWKIDPETGHAACVGVVVRDCPWSNVRFGQAPDGRVLLAVTGWWLDGDQDIRIFERLGPGDWALRTTLGRIFNDPANRNSGLVGVRVWADANGDQAEQPDEVAEHRIELGGWINRWYMPMNQKLVFTAGPYVVAPTGWTACGAPRYDFAQYEPMNIDPGEMAANRLGADRGGIVSEDGTKVIFNAFYGVQHGENPCYDLTTGKRLFIYPSNYVGVHGGHSAPPAKQGLIRAAYDFVGTVEMPAPLGNLFFVGTDRGEWHILNDRGFYVSSLFEGDPMRIQWPAEAIPGANLNNIPPGMGAEDFGGSIIKATDGRIYVQCGKTAFINARLDGLETAREIPGGTLSIGNAELVQAERFKAKYLSVGDSAAEWTAPRREVAFTGDPRRDFGIDGVSYGPDNARVTSWLAHDGSNLLLAWQVHDATPWVNGAPGFENMYAMGDTVDFQLGTDTAADPKRDDAVLGDLRLSIGSRNGGEPEAVLYRKVSETKAPKVFHSGVWANYEMDYVAKVPDAVIQAFPGGNGYVVEASIPAAALGFELEPGLALKGDFGVTFGDPAGKDTILRTYWANQAAGIVADEVAELMIRPSLWGSIVFE